MIFNFTEYDDGHQNKEDEVRVVGNTRGRREHKLFSKYLNGQRPIEKLESKWGGGREILMNTRKCDVKRRIGFN
jgi:hypothetical protein